MCRAIDGTHVSAMPPANVTQAHKSRKSTITTNVLCVYNMDMQFTYVHAKWKGSANDLKVLKEAISDPKHGFPWPPVGTIHYYDFNTYSEFVLCLCLDYNCVLDHCVFMQDHTMHYYDFVTYSKFVLCLCK